MMLNSFAALKKKFSSDLCSRVFGEFKFLLLSCFVFFSLWQFVFGDVVIAFWD